MTTTRPMQPFNLTSIAQKVHVHEGECRPWGAKGCKNLSLEEKPIALAMGDDCKLRGFAAFRPQGGCYPREHVPQKVGKAYYSPEVVAQFNNHDLRLALFKGDYHWHSHTQDEMFMVFGGEITIETEGETYHLKQGEGMVIPKGVRHCPRATDRAVVLLVVPSDLDPLGETDLIRECFDCD